MSCFRVHVREEDSMLRGEVDRGGKEEPFIYALPPLRHISTAYCFRIFQIPATGGVPSVRSGSFWRCWRIPSTWNMERLTPYLQSVSCKGWRVCLARKRIPADRAIVPKSNLGKSCRGQQVHLPFQEGRRLEGNPLTGSNNPRIALSHVLE
ncbi:uncharacterized protein BDV14DRAFT_182721 [Aspergillus stella-maris]|uniref:uncharacterized protein n=1 Tax=Aspergillus stella-maris TaxID=1810926 RepID=UPI003CCDC6C8